MLSSSAVRRRRGRGAIVRSVPCRPPSRLDTLAALVSSRPPPRPTRSRSTTLDDPKADPTPPPPPRGPRGTPPGLTAQIGATRDAIVALIRAHIDLAKTEAGAIAGQVGRLIALGLLALILVLAAIFLAVIGTALFTGEWLLGSMGWGVLHGVLFFAAIAMAAVLVGIGVSAGRIGRALLMAVVVGVVVGLIFGLALPNRLYVAIGDAVGSGVEAGDRPLIVGLFLGGLLGLVVGVLLAARASGATGLRIALLVVAIVVGAAIGAFTAIAFGAQVGAGIGITVGYITWMAMMGIDVARTGVDVDSLKKRFYPATTIETSKETLEWLQKRMPPGIGS